MAIDHGGLVGDHLVVGEDTGVLLFGLGDEAVRGCCDDHVEVVDERLLRRTVHNGDRRT